MKTLLTLAIALCPIPVCARTFVGGGGNANWSTGANWSPAGAPAAGDSLVFLIGTSSSNNNLSAATFHDLTFNARHTLSGNPFTLTHGIAASPLRGLNGVTVSPAITLGLDQTFSVTSGILTCSGNLALNGHQLTVSVTGGDSLVLGAAVSGAGTASRIVKNGSGTLRLSGVAVHAGGVELNAGTLDVPGLISGSTITMKGGRITGNGTLPAVSATGGEISPTGGDLSATGAFTLGPAVTVLATITGPGAVNRVSVSGSLVDLNDAELVIDSTAYQPAWGEVFTLFSKGPAGPITGTFKNLPQGAEVPLNATTAGRISYTGGNGNDVALTIISTTRTWDGGKTINDNWDEAENWSGDILPHFGDVLVFPPGIGSTDRGMDNNFPVDTTFRQLVFNGDDYTVRGNRYRLSHGITVADGVTANLDTDVVLALDQTFALDGRLHLDVLDEIDTNGHTLTLASGPENGGVIDGNIAGSGGVVVASGAQITFEERTTYTGITSIEAGGRLTLYALQLGPGGASLGSSAGGTEIRGTLELENGRPNDPMKTADDLRLFPGGTLRLIDGFGHILGNESRVEVAGSLTLEGSAADVIHMEMRGGRDDITGVISGGGALILDTNLNFDDERLAFSGSGRNTFTGPLTVTGGRLLLEKASAGLAAVSGNALRIESPDDEFTIVETRQDEQIADSCNVTLGTNGVLDIGNITSRTETIGSLTFDGSAAISSAIRGPSGSSLIVRGSISVTSAGTALPSFKISTIGLRVEGKPCVLDVAAKSAPVELSIGGSVSRAGTAAFRKTGGGLVEFAGAVSVPLELVAGEVRYSGNGSGSPVSLSGGRLGGRGSVGSLTGGTGGGIVAPGENDAGVLTSGAIIWNTATTLVCEIANPTAGSGHDRLVAQGTVGLGGATLQLVELSGFNVPLGGQVFPLLNDGTDPIIGTFGGLPEGAFIPITAANGGGGWTISYLGGDGNDVSLTRVVTPPVEVPPTVTGVTFGNPDQNGNRTVTVAGKGTPGASYRLENSVNLTDWTPDGAAQTANATTGALNFTSTASPPVRTKQFWRFRKL